MINKSAAGVSIIICCYNSATRLPETLKHISLQKVDGSIPWEVIVVNNASKDNTGEVARQVWKQLGSPIAFQVVDEPVPGLSNARERGLLTARYEFLLYCDDDNWLDATYMERVYRLMMTDLQIGALGGRGIPICEIPPSKHLQSRLHDYATGQQAPESGDVSNTKGFVYGAGSVYRKSVLNSLRRKGFKNYLTDRLGNQLSGGGDIEICRAMTLAGYKIWYDEQLTFKHFIPKERLTWQYMKKMHQGNGRIAAYLFPYNWLVRRQEKRHYKYTWYWLLTVNVWMLLKRELIKLPMNVFSGGWHSYQLYVLARVGCIQSIWQRKGDITKSFEAISMAEWVHDSYRRRA